MKGMLIGLAQNILNLFVSEAVPHTQLENYSTPEILSLLLRKESHFAAFLTYEQPCSG